MNIHSILSDKVIQAMMSAGILENFDPQVRQSTKLQFGDYQINGIMAIAKKNGYQPLELANKVMNKLDLDDIISKLEVSGPGFINIFLNRSWLANQTALALKLPFLGINTVSPKTVVIDYSSPNVAKEMHIGHVRSTIIGDAVARTLSVIGHNVIRANHIGDWGTQFGMLIAYLAQQNKKYNKKNITISDLEIFYREARNAYVKDVEFATNARACVVKLQNGDEHCRNIWRKLVKISLDQNQKIYNRLNVTLTHKDVMGESLYNNMLPNIISDLRKKGLAVTSRGATVVFLDEFKNKEGQPMGVLIQKKDGGYLYTTTDIACVKYRCETLHADRILYYTDLRQNQHLQQVWAIAKKAGYIPQSISLEHHAFGMILGKDGRPFRTRSGQTIKLNDLLDEAVERAMNLIRDKNPKISQQELKILAKIIGIGAVKYADLSKNRVTNYVFDWDQMLSFDGNTAPYMQYAYTRVTSLLEKSKININNLHSEILLIEDIEAQLAKKLLQFEEVITQVARDGTPHIMCSYLYNLAGWLSNFYENCPIISAKDKKIKYSRLQLAALTAKTLKLGLDTLGIKTVKRM